MDRLIASYDKNDIIYLSSTDSLTKIDGNSSETYDELVSQRKEVSDGITQIITRINNYNLLMEDLLTMEEIAAIARCGAKLGIDRVKLTGGEPQSIVPLAGAGSNRRYFRVVGKDSFPTLIAVIGTNQEGYSPLVGAA